MRAIRSRFRGHRGPLNGVGTRTKLTATDASLVLATMPLFFWRGPYLETQETDLIADFSVGDVQKISPPLAHLGEVTGPERGYRKWEDGEWLLAPRRTGRV